MTDHFIYSHRISNILVAPLDQEAFKEEREQRWTLSIFCKKVFLTRLRNDSESRKDHFSYNAITISLCLQIIKQNNGILAEDGGVC